MSTVVVDDLMGGVNEWRNIQEIVRLTFKALTDLVRSQGEAIKNLERVMETRVSRTELSTAMSSKSELGELSIFEDRLSRLAGDVESLIHTMSTCPTRSEVIEVETSMRSLLAWKAENADVVGQLESTRHGLYEHVEVIGRRIEERIDLVEKEVACKASTLTVADEFERKVDWADFNAAIDRKANLQDMKDALGEKANKASVNAALHKKANKTDVESELKLKANKSSVEKALAKKADAELMSTQLNDRPTREETKEIATEKATAVSYALQKARGDLDLSIEKNRSDLEEAIRTTVDRAMDDIRQRLEEKKNMIERVDSRCSSLKGETLEEFTTLREEMRTGLHKLDEHLGVKVDQTEQSADHKALDLQGQIERLKEYVDTKAEAHAVKDALNQKMDANEALKALDSKASLGNLTEAKSELKAETQMVKEKLTTKTQIDEEIVEELRRELLLKSNIKDVCTLLDMKADLEHVNNAFGEVNVALDKRASVEDLNVVVTDQQVINEALCAEHFVGRWIWKSGKVKPNNAVPWNVQSVNTNPGNFVWEKDRSTLITVAPGLYEVTFGFYARKKPSVQLLVNGEPCLSAVNSASYVVHHSSGRLTSIGRHPAGNITGLTMIDFLALPANAKITCTYNGEEGEGFIGLRKL